MGFAPAYLSSVCFNLLIYPVSDVKVIFASSWLTSYKPVPLVTFGTHCSIFFVNKPISVTVVLASDVLPA